MGWGLSFFTKQMLGPRRYLSSAAATWEALATSEIKCLKEIMENV